jgi:UbiD family decarboxylase
MAFKSLQHFISALEQAGELVRVDEFVSPKLEIPEIVDRLSKNNGPAVLFTNNGTSFPLLINSMGSEKRICMALGLTSLDQVRDQIGGLVREFLGPKTTLLDKLRLLPALKDVASWMPKPVGGRGACQEVVMDPPDLGTFRSLPAGLPTEDLLSPCQRSIRWTLKPGSATSVCTGCRSSARTLPGCTGICTKVPPIIT